MSQRRHATQTASRKGRELIRQMEDVAEVTPSPMLHVHLRYAHAVLADEAEAEPLFRAALEAPDLGGWPWIRARTELAYGSWLRRQRRVAESRTPLRAARDVFAAMGATSWSRQAAAELRAAGERQPDPDQKRDLPHTLLSPQELQIAGLAAQGLSNREIGEQLFLSHRTIGSHLYRIFPKLGITARAQLAGRLKAVPSAGESVSSPD
jgi:DNA-binding CsgD family transcriptional regulator